MCFSGNFLTPLFCDILCSKKKCASYLSSCDSSLSNKNDTEIFLAHFFEFPLLGKIFHLSLDFFVFAYCFICTNARRRFDVKLVLHFFECFNLPLFCVFFLDYHARGEYVCVGD